MRTILGRRRQIPELQSRVPHIRSQGNRFAVNTVVQGSAADLIKKAMVETHDKLAEQSWPARMILQIHDELLFEVPESNMESVSATVKAVMENVLELNVPLIVNLSHGKNWCDASK